MRKLVPVLIDALPTTLVRQLSSLKHAPVRFRSARKVQRLLPDICEQLQAEPQPLHRILAARGDLAVVGLEATPTSPSCVIKIAWTPEAEHQIQREADILAGLALVDELKAIATSIPECLASGQSQGHQWVAQTALMGIETDTSTPDAATLWRALAALAPLHAATAHDVAADDLQDLLQRLVAQPFDTVREHASERAHSILSPIEQEFGHFLTASPPLVGHIHGDAAPANLLWHGGSAGLVDWELADPALPAELDIGQFVLAYTSESGQAEYGSVVAQLLHRDLSPLPSGTSEALTDTPNSWPLPLIVTLAWAHHVAANLTKAQRYRTNDYWKHHNIEVVLDALERVAEERGTAGMLQS